MESDDLMAQKRDLREAVRMHANPSFLSDLAFISKFPNPDMSETHLIRSGGSLVRRDLGLGVGGR